MLFIRRNEIRINTCRVTERPFVYLPGNTILSETDQVLFRFSTHISSCQKISSVPFVKLTKAEPREPHSSEGSALMKRVGHNNVTWHLGEQEVIELSKLTQLIWYKLDIHR